MNLQNWMLPSGANWYKFKIKRPLFLFSLILSVALYYYIVDFYDPGNNFIRQVREWCSDEPYQFFSDSPNGFNSKIGVALQDMSAKGGYINVENNNVRDSVEILQNVAVTPKSFGIIQNDAFNVAKLKGCRLKDDVQIIGPLYTEYIHVLYRPDCSAVSETDDETRSKDDSDSSGNAASQKRHKSKHGRFWRNRSLTLRFCPEPNKKAGSPKRNSINNGTSSNNTPEGVAPPEDNTNSGAPSNADSQNPDEEKEEEDEACDYFNNSKIRVCVDRYSVGAQPLGTTILNLCGVNELGQREEQSSFSRALAKLEYGDVEAVFCVVAAPLREIEDLLQRQDDIRLMNIEGQDLLKALNAERNSSYFIAEMNDCYHGHRRINTFGASAVLIASKDVSDRAVLQLLNSLSKAVDQHKSAQPFEAANKPFPIEMDDLKYARERALANHRIGMSRTIRNLILFITAVAVGAYAILTFLSISVSASTQAWYYRRAVDVCKKALAPPAAPKPSNDEDDDIELTDSQENARRAVERKRALARIFRGLKLLDKLAQEITESFTHNGISESHLKFLLDKVERSRDVLRKAVAKKLYRRFKHDEPDLLGRQYLLTLRLKDLLNQKDLDVLLQIAQERRRRPNEEPEVPPEAENKAET